MPANEPIFAHVCQDARGAVLEAYVTGQPVTALCGRTFIPTRDPAQFPPCPACEALKAAELVLIDAELAALDGMLPADHPARAQLDAVIARRRALD